MAQYRHDIKARWSPPFSLPLLSFACWICVRLSLFIAEKEKASSRLNSGTCIAQNKRRHCCLNIPGKRSHSTLEWEVGWECELFWFVLSRASFLHLGLGGNELIWTHMVPQTKIRSHWEEEGESGYPKVDSHLISFRYLCHTPER